MTNWNTLPPEVHDHILQFICEDIINTYTSLSSRKNMRRGYRHWIRISGQAGLQWPAAPLCLQHISSATKVCRSFYHSIVHRIKFNTVAPMEHLQSLQYDAVHKFCRFPEEFDSDLVIAQVHVGFFMSLAGVFWKNPKVLEDNRLIIDVLRVLQKTSVMMLIPHIEEWLYSRAEPGAYEENPDDGYTSVTMKNAIGELDARADIATFGRSGTGSLSIEDDHESGHFSIFTVNGLYRGFRQEFVY
jgi:hypothetical protein